MKIDISSNNGVIDFKKIFGVDEVIIRATLGYADKDRMLDTYAQKCFAVGMPVSYYHFAYPDTKTGGSVESDARAEANWFVDTINKLPRYQNIYVDLENWSTTQDSSLSKEDYALWLKTWLDVVESRTQTQPIIYTYADYLNQHLPQDHDFGKYRLWIANYSAKENPPLPHGWDKWFMWQYQEHGKLPGQGCEFDFSKANI